MDTLTGATLDNLRCALPELVAEPYERGEEFELAHQLALDFTDRLKAAGAYRVLLTPEQGGLAGARRGVAAVCAFKNVRERVL